MNDKHTLIGKRIKEFRMQKGITQAKLAEEIDCTPAYLSCIETGKKTLSLGKLICIANALSVGTDELLRDELRNNSTAWNQVFLYLWSDCSEFEKRVITDTLLAQKQAIRNHMECWRNPER